MPQIEYFGPAKDFTNITTESLSNISSLSELYNHFSLKYSIEFKNFVEENCGITLNFEYIDKNNLFMKFNEKDEICIIPPVSSG